MLKPYFKNDDCILFNTNNDNAINQDEDILYKLKISGQRLKEMLGITEEDIDRAIKELRRDW